MNGTYMPMKNWLPRIGWMFLGVCFLLIGIGIHWWLFGERGHMLRNVQASQMSEIISNLKKEGCEYVVIINAPRTCKDTLDNAVKQSGPLGSGLAF